MVTVGLIITPWFYWIKQFVHQPLTQLYLATLIDEHFDNKAVSVRIIDLRGIKQEEIQYHIPRCDIYLYSVTSPDFTLVKSLIEELKCYYPGSKHVAGGIHINIFPKESAKVFDAIVLGEGEKSLIKLIDDFLKDKLKDIYNEKPGLELTKYPFPRRHYIPAAAVVNTSLFKSVNIRGTAVLFARGCPFKCGFCANVTPRSPQIPELFKLKEEIDYLKKEYRIEGLALNDEVCIPVNEKQATSFLETLGQANVKWRGQTRVGFTQQSIKIARQSGCLELALGIESASEQVLDIVNKKIKLIDVEKAIRLCKENGIKVQMCLIIGLPGEPTNIVSLTKSFIEENQPDYVMLAGFCPYPGSAIYNNPQYYGIKRIGHDYSRHTHFMHRYRDYKEEKDTGIPFEYYPENRWGRTFTRQEIINNVVELQDFLIAKGFNR